MPARGLAALFVLLSTMVFATDARAERVAVLRPSAPSDISLEIFARVCGELRQHDFEVLVVEPDSVAPLADGIVLLPGESDKRAVVEVELHGSTSSADAALKLVGALGEDGPRLLAAQVVDVLRALPRPASAHPSAVPPSAIAPPPAAHRAAWALRAGGLFLADPLRFGVGGGPSAGLELVPSSRFHLALLGAGPLWGFHDRTVDTRVRVIQALVLAEVGLRAWTSDRVSLAGAIGLGAHYFDASGEVIRHQPGLAGSSDSLVSAAVIPALRMAFRITDSLELQAGVQAVWLATRPLVWSQQESLAPSRWLPGASLGVRWEL